MNSTVLQRRVFALASILLLGVSACKELSAPAGTPAAPVATKLAFTVQPSNTTSKAAIAPAVQVAVQDVSGNTVTSANYSIALGLGANPGNAALSGNASVTTVNGVATFNAISIDKVGTGYTLVASAGGLTGATSTGFNVAEGTGAKLVFTVQPANTAAGAAIAPAVEVTVQDASGNTITSATNSITVGIDNNPSTGTLSGTMSVAAVNGVATFSNLSIDKIGTGYTLIAIATGLESANSAMFDVTVGAAAKLAFTVQPTNTLAGAAITPAVQVLVQDAAGNTVTTATNGITMAIGTNPAGGTLSGTATVAAVNGVATFSNLSIDNAGGGYTLVAGGLGLTGATSAAFNIATAGGGSFHWESFAPPARVAGTDLYHVATAGGQVWASGANGTIIHYTDVGGWVVDTVGMTGRDTITGCPEAFTGGCGLVTQVYGLFMWTFDGGGIGGIAVGGSGSGLRYYFDGTNWTRQSSGTSTLMSAIGVGAAVDNAPAQWWACGRAGITYRALYPNHFDRFYWDTTSAPVAQVNNDLNACGGTDVNDVFAAGSGGFLAHFDGNAWAYAPYHTNTTQTLNGITHCGGRLSATDWWLVGNAGVIRHAASPFTTFTAQASGTTAALYGVDAATCTDVYAVGASGTILHYNGATWSAQSSGTIQLLSSVAVRFNGDGSFRDAWAVGHNGVILHGTN